MELIYWEILGIAAALVFSAFFSASETALTSLPRVKLQQILDSRRFWGRSLVLWQVHPNRIWRPVCFPSGASPSPSAL